MSNPQQSPPTEVSQPKDQHPAPAQQSQDALRARRQIYNVALGTAIICPLVAALPPRKLDLFTFGLGITWTFCLSHVIEENTGRNLIWHVGSMIPSEGTRAARRKLVEERGEIAPGSDEPQRQRSRGFIKRMWMGDAPDNWVEERARKEKEALDQGRGYTGLIMDQVREVLNGKSEVTREADESDEKDA